MAITIVGLGPGSYRALTLEVAEALRAARELYLRTAQHPTVAELPPTIRWTAFDDLYEQAASFDALYAQIATLLLERGARPRPDLRPPDHGVRASHPARRGLRHPYWPGAPGGAPAPARRLPLGRAADAREPEALHPGRCVRGGGSDR